MSTDTQDRILEAARRVFLRHGTAGARMQQIADEAGVNKALLHYHFDSKAALAERVFVRAARQLLPPVLEVLGSELTIEEKVERVIRLELERLSENPFLPGYVLTELHSQPERAGELMRAVLGARGATVAAGVVEILGGQLRTRAEEGSLRAVEPREFIVNLLALCIFPFAARPMLEEMLGLDDESFHRFIEGRKETLPGLFLEGIRPRETRP